MSNLIVGAVPVTMINIIWPMCVEHLERVVAKAPDDISLETIKAGLLNGKSMMITVSEGDQIIAVNTVEQVTYETGHRVLFIPLVGGDRMDEWMERFLDIVHAIARDMNCDELRGMACRKGWLRALTKAGQNWYDIHAVVGCKVKQIEEIK